MPERTVVYILREMIEKPSDRRFTFIKFRMPEMAEMNTTPGRSKYDPQRFEISCLDPAILNEPADGDC